MATESVTTDHIDIPRPGREQAANNVHVVVTGYVGMRF
jgi:hypothetical protein